MSTVYRAQRLALAMAVAFEGTLATDGRHEDAKALRQAREACIPYLPRVHKATEDKTAARILDAAGSIRGVATVTLLAACTMLEWLTCRTWMALWRIRPETPRELAWRRLHHLAADIHRQADPQWQDGQSVEDGMAMARRMVEVVG